MLANMLKHLIMISHHRSSDRLPELPTCLFCSCSRGKRGELRGRESPVVTVAVTATEAATAYTARVHGQGLDKATVNNETNETLNSAALDDVIMVDTWTWTYLLVLGKAQLKALGNAILCMEKYARTC
jgi:hypothetical protein